MIKYLGVFIDSKQTFNYHVNQKCHSATTILNLLRRNLYFAPKSVKAKAYLSCVLPIIEYANVCWSPTTDKQKHKLEMVQHRAAKFATNSYPKKGHYQDFSISSLLSDLEWNTLEVRSNRAKFGMAYKILNGQVILSPDTLPKNSKQSRTRNHVKVGKENQLLEPLSTLVAPGKTFFYSVQKLWNDNVTPSQAKATSIDAFKNNFDKK